MLGGDSDGVLCPRAYVDASYGVHTDGKSHTDNVITLRRGPIFCKSSKQKSVTKSSCEAEILALSELISTVAWIRNFLQEIEVQLEPPLALEDNKAVIFSSLMDRVQLVEFE